MHDGGLERVQRRLVKALRDAYRPCQRVHLDKVLDSPWVALVVVEHGKLEGGMVCRGHGRMPPLSYYCGRAANHMLGGRGTPLAARYCLAPETFPVGRLISAHTC